MTTVRLPDRFEPPDETSALAKYKRGKKLVHLGWKLPVPFVRPWLRRRGDQLITTHGKRTEIRVTLGDWNHQASYGVVDFDSMDSMPLLSLQERFRWWWAGVRNYTEESLPMYWLRWLRGWAVSKGIW